MKKFCILLVITENYSVIQPKIKNHLKLKNQLIIYPNSELALNGVKHNMPGGDYILCMLGPLSDHSFELIHKVKNLKKSNKVFIYANAKPQKMELIDKFIHAVNIDDDLEKIQFLFNN